MARIILQDGREPFYNVDGIVSTTSMPTIKVNKKPITITNTGVMTPIPSAEEKALRRSKGEVWDEINKTWKKVDESGIIDKAIDIFNPKNNTQVTIDKNKITIDEKKKDNTLYYVLGSALIVVAGYVAYKKLR
jgi:hypothetical protein